MVDKEKEVSNEELDDKEEVLTKKDEVEQKIRKQIEKKQEKDSHFGVSRLKQYIAEEHKWENFLFVFLSLLLLILGSLILNGAVTVRSGVPLLGSHPTLFAWIFVIAGALFLLYALWPFYKPAIPEFKKITWLTMPKFFANLARVFIFMIILIAVLYLYDAFISEIYILIFD